MITLCEHKKINYYFICIYAFLLFIQCVSDAERKNPYDPNSAIYKDYGVIQGTVYTLYPPYQPLADVKLALEPLASFTYTDNSGQFRFQNLSFQDYSLVVNKQGYAADTCDIIVTNKQAEINHDFYLNGLPYFSDQVLNVGHISRWWPTDDLYVLNSEISVNDPDGIADILNVYLIIPGFQFQDTLSRTSNPDVFQRLFTINQIPVNSIHELPGYEIVLKIQDRPGYFCTSQPKFISRIVEDTPLTVSPKGLQIVDSRPHLEWVQFDADFPFTIQLDIVRVDQGINTIIWSQDGIPADSTGFRVDESLVLGTYYWTVTIEDEFGNWSRSREASFIVQ